MGPTRTPTRTSSPTSSRGSSRESRRVRRARKSARRAAARAARSACHEPADLSTDFCPTRAFPREDVRWGCARVHVYMINYRVHVYQNYTIGASLKSVSVSVSVTWNLSLTLHFSSMAAGRCRSVAVHCSLRVTITRHVRRCSCSLRRDDGSERCGWSINATHTQRDRDDNNQ